MNEAVLYIFCLFLIYFSILETSTESRFTLGFVFMVIFLVWVCLNFLIVIWQALRFVKLLIKRGYYRILGSIMAK